MSTNTKAFIGIDAGTTGCTVMIFDEKGNALGHGYKEYPSESPYAGWGEQSLEKVWDGICVASKQATSQANLPMMPMSRSDFPANAAPCAFLTRIRSRFRTVSCGIAPGRATIRRSSASTSRQRNIRNIPVCSSAPLGGGEDSLVARQQARHVREDGLFANGQEYFLYLLGADRWETDPASLTLNGMMDIRKLDWSDRVLEMCGISRDRVPPVGPPSGMVGKVSKQASEATGIPEGVILCRGAGDQQCAAIGAGVIRQGMAEFTVGTAGVMVAHLDSVDRIKGKNLWWGGHGVPNAWDIEGGAFCLGASLKWWRDNLGLDEVQEAKAATPALFGHGGQGSGVAGRRAGTAVPPVPCQPGHAYYDADSRGGLIGLGNYHTRVDLVRALLEGCAHEMKMVVDAFQSDIDGGISTLRLTGGGTKSAGFSQIMTDVIGMETEVTKEKECTVLGAAILGAFGSGHFTSIDEAVDQMVQIEGTLPRTRSIAPCMRSITPSIGAFTKRLPMLASTRVSPISRRNISKLNPTQVTTQEETMPIPGMRGMEHIGFTVPDINEACDFFERILGAEVLYTAATNFRVDDSDWMAEHLHVHPRAVITEFRYLRCGNGTNLEVFQYEFAGPEQDPSKERRHRRSSSGVLC